MDFVISKAKKAWNAYYQTQMNTCYQMETSELHEVKEEK